MGNLNLLPKNLITKFEELLSNNGFNINECVDIANGICVLNKEGNLAFVCMDGRYPNLQDGYSLNTKCTEKITIIDGFCNIKINDKNIELKKGEHITIEPGNKYSITGTIIARDDISPNRESSQNSYTKI